MNELCFTVEINDKLTRMCDLRMKSNKIELVSMGAIETAMNFFDTDNQLVLDRQVEIIKRLYGNLRIKKKEVNVIIPDSHTFSQIIDMPKLKEKELIAAIRYQADEFIPMSIDETYLDLEILSEDKKNKKLLVLIVASPKKVVDNVFQTIEKAGLTPGCLENEMSAAGRLFSEVLSIVQEPYIVINVGYTSSSIYLIDGRTKMILFARTIKIGVELFVKDLKINLNWDEHKILEAMRNIGLAKSGSVNLGTIVLPILKELITEIEKFKMIVNQNMNLQVGHIFMYNYDTQLAYLPQYLEAYFKIPVRTAPIHETVVANPIAKSFSAELSSYVSVISGHFR
ncbi:MAG: pilus assembly protein PilM [Patescibacteria group bacterium]